jgi:dTDP-4-amino-4,6-dideoxy-D-galactose acyltransferase
VPTSAESEPCELLQWDTTFFGRRIARVRADTLTPSFCQAIDNWAAQHQIDLLYLLAKPDDRQTTELAEQQGYQLVDIRMTFERPLDAIPLPEAKSTATICPAKSSDRESLITLARQSHRTTRFYFDARIPREKADDLYAAWMVRDLKGDIAVAGQNGQVVGYNTFSYDPERKIGAIGLTAVAESHRGTGIGQALMQDVLQSLQDRSATKVTVVTQGRNLPAQRLYARCGFIPSNLQLYYHRWFAPDRHGAKQNTQ